MKAIEKDKLKITCNVLSRLVEYEMKNEGFFCIVNEIHKKIPGDVYLVIKYQTGINGNLKEFEDEFFKKYKIKIKFESNSSHAKSEFFFIPAPL